MSVPCARLDPDPLVGQLLAERYRVLRRLGQGGMGTVYEARHVLIDKPVAIKVLLPRYAADESVIARFQREALAVARAGSEHVIDVTDVGQLATGGWFIVFELLDGRDWSAELRETGPQPLATAAHIVCQVCSAVQAAHERGVVHRDLKPGNVFLLRRGGDPNFVKVLDFGLAKIRDLSPGDAATAPQAPLGTPDYMSPEQMEGRADVDLRSDLYALGVILFEALTGTVPFTADTARQLMIKVLSQPAPLLSQLRPELPTAVVELVARLLEKDPERRPASCAEVRAVLLPFARTTADSTPAPTAAKASTRPPAVTAPAMPMSGVETGAEHAGEHPFARELRRRRRRRAGAALLAGAAIGAVLWLVSNGLPPERARPPAAVVGHARAKVATVAPAGDRRAADQVTLHLDVQPADATITLDGTPLDNAVAQPLPRSEQPRRLRVSHAGYVSIERTLVLLAEQRVAISLALEPPARSAPPPRRAGTDPLGEAEVRAEEGRIETDTGPVIAPPPAPALEAAQSELLPMPL